MTYAPPVRKVSKGLHPPDDRKSDFAPSDPLQLELTLMCLQPVKVSAHPLPNDYRAGLLPYSRALVPPPPLA